jgi:hypothetical protein
VRPAATINALNQITNVNVISSPTLTVMDNRTPFSQIGDQVPITTQSAAVLATGAPARNTVAYRALAKRLEADFERAESPQSSVRFSARLLV